MNAAFRTLAATLAVAAGFAPAVARADLFQIDWGYRWSWGYIQHETGWPDLDPSPSRSFYADAVRDFAFVAHDEWNFKGFSGSGGDVIVENTPVACEFEAPACYQRKVTFELGAVFADEGDPALYQLRMWFQPVTVPWASHTPGLDQEWHHDVTGSVGSEGGTWYGAMSTYTGATNTRLATPVPEPGTLALALAGLGLAVAGSRRRSR